jgi:hypothetical protein
MSANLLVVPLTVSALFFTLAATTPKKMVAVDMSIQKGARWLASVQGEEGGWGQNSGVTSSVGEESIGDPRIPDREIVIVPRAKRHASAGFGRDRTVAVQLQFVEPILAGRQRVRTSSIGSMNLALVKLAIVRLSRGAYREYIRGNWCRTIPAERITMRGKARRAC